MALRHFSAVGFTTNLAWISPEALLNSVQISQHGGGVEGVSRVAAAQKLEAFGIGRTASRQQCVHRTDRIQTHVQFASYAKQKGHQVAVSGGTAARAHYRPHSYSSLQLHPSQVMFSSFGRDILLGKHLSENGAKTVQRSHCRCYIQEPGVGDQHQNEDSRIERDGVGNVSTATKTLSVGDDVEHGELSKPEPAGQARVRNPQGNECVAGCGADEVVARQLLQANEAALDGLRPKPEVAAKVPAFQVQSPQEQEILAATPSHPKALTALYWSYMLVCYVEHLWRFAWPAVLCLLNHSLLPVAVASFVGQLLIFTAGPWVGELMDNAPRVSAFNTLAVAQAVAMAVSAGVTIFALHTEATLGVTANALVFQPWFLVLVLAGGVERITGLASGVAFERDWVVQLAGPNRPIALANANAILRRVDLFCEIAGPLSFGWLLSNYNSLFCVNTAVVIMAISLPVLLGLVALTDRLSKGVLQRPRYTAAKLAQDALEESNNPSGSSGFGAFLRGWKQFLKQPVLPASIAYVLLFFNTVLAPGSLMTSFLTTRGLDVSLVGGFRGACAAMGFLATFVSAPLIARVGVLKAGAVALTFQSVMLAASVLLYFLTPDTSQLALLCFLVLVVLSRLGLWTYDVVDAQIFQTAIPVSQANIVGTTEVALASLAELVMLAVAIVAHDVSYFGGLAALSMASVLGATLIYWRWLGSRNADQRRLFPNEPHFLEESKKEQ